MGMFDYFYCEYEIDAPEGLEFQTKDTDAQYLENYKIDKDGYLWHEYREYKWSPDPEREKDGGLLAMVGALKTTTKEWRRQDGFRGSINFYTDHKGDWLEFSALFDKGKVINIEKISPPTSIEHLL